MEDSHLTETHQNGLMTVVAGTITEKIEDHMIEMIGMVVTKDVTCIAVIVERE